MCVSVRVSECLGLHVQIGECLVVSDRVYLYVPMCAYVCRCI